MADRNYVTSDFASRLERARRKIDRRPQSRLLPNVPRPPVPPIVSSLFRVYNNSSETIPQFAVMQVEDLSERTGFSGTAQDAYAVKQYDGTGELLLINAGEEIQQRRFGSGIFPSEPAKILIDPSASPSFGDQYGPVVGAWYLGPSSVGGAWQLADGTDADYEYLGQSDGETATFRQRQQHDSLVIGVTIASDAATTATVDSRPVGMARVPKETGGEVPFENPSDITIPEDGIKGHLVYVTRSGTKQWELIADSTGRGDQIPPNDPNIKAVYIGITDATDIHALGDTQDVTVYIDNDDVTVSAYNPLMDVPPQTWVVLAWCYEPLTSGGQWTIIGTSFTGILGKSYSTYSKGETAGEVTVYEDTSTSYAVNITGVHFPFAGVASGKWVSITYNGHIWYAEELEAAASTTPSYASIVNASISHSTDSGTPTKKVAGIFSAGNAGPTSGSAITLDAGDDRCEINEDGNYEITFRARTRPASTVTNSQTWEIYKSGSAMTSASRMKDLFESPLRYDGSVPIQALTMVRNRVALVAGDYLEVYVTFSLTDSLTITDAVFEIRKA